MINAETGVRGYSASANPLFLSPYNQSMARLAGDLAGFRAAAVAEGSVREERVMAATTARERSQLTQLRAAVANGISGTSLGPRMAAGKATMDLLRREEAALTDKPAAILITRRTEVNRLEVNAAPLNAVLGFAQLLQMSDLVEEDKDSVERILAAGRHLLALINELIDITRIESGEFSLSVEPVQLLPVVGEICRLMTPLAADRSITINRGHRDRPAARAGLRRSHERAAHRRERGRPGISFHAHAAQGRRYPVCPAPARRRRGRTGSSWEAVGRDDPDPLYRGQSGERRGRGQVPAVQAAPATAFGHVRPVRPRASRST